MGPSLQDWTSRFDEGGMRIEEGKMKEGYEARTGQELDAAASYQGVALGREVCVHIQH